MKILPKALAQKKAVQWQLYVVLLWSLGLGTILFFWISSSLVQLQGGFPSVLLVIGRLLGLVATYAALTQLLLMGRIWWIERFFGLDQLARYHRVNGYIAIIGIILHAATIVAQHALVSGTNYFAEYINTILTYENVIFAAIAQGLFITVVVSSIYIVRKRLKFESWYYVHLAVYLAIVLASLHQFAIGTTFLSLPLAKGFWFGLYGFVALNLLIWRFGLPVYRLFNQDFRVAKLVKETPSVTSVYISANDVSKLSVIAGQFVLVRFFAKGFWSQEHPFTVSWQPKGNQLRLSIRASGDFTQTIPKLPIGARVMVSGPFGRFTSERAVMKKSLFVAGGIGITPLRSMMEESSQSGIDAVLLYANRAPDDVPLKKELDELAQSNSLRIVYVYSDAPSAAGEHGYVDADLIKNHVKDVATRDIYICGPPVMMAGVEKGLRSLGVPAEQIHTEKFAIHP